MSDVRKVLIVGGGIARLTLGRALHRNGFAVDLVERSTEWRTEGGGVAVQRNGIRVLRALGLQATVEQAGARIDRWSFCDEMGSRSRSMIWWRCGAT